MESIVISTEVSLFIFACTVFFMGTSFYLLFESINSQLLMHGKDKEIITLKAELGRS